MYVILVLLITTQYFCGHVCQVDRSSNEFSSEFTSENFTTALIEFENNLLSSNLNYNCNISLTIRFYSDKGFVNVQCFNEIENRSNGLHFHMITTLNGNKFEYYGGAYYVCLFNNLCDQSFINDWILWQINAINNTIQAQKQFNQENNFSFSKFQLWSLLDYNEIDLCTDIFVDQNQNFSGSTIDVNVICLRCKYNYKNIINSMSTLINKLSNLVTLPNSLNNNKIIIEQTSKTLFNNITHTYDQCTSSWSDTNQTIPEDVTTKPDDNKSNNKSLLNLIIYGIIILFLLLLLILGIICFIYRQKYGSYDRASATAS